MFSLCVVVPTLSLVLGRSGVLPSPHLTSAVRRHSHSSSHSHGVGDEDEEEIFFEIPEFSVLAESITDEAQPIAKRMRSCFLLKQIGDEASIEVLAKGLRSPSVLMAHECGYVLGQLQNKAALPFLREILSDRSMNPIVRHECAEAMGAIGLPESMDILVEFSKDASEEVAETCLIAIERLKWNAANPGVTYDSKYCSVDPAPRTDDKTQTVASIQAEMMDKNKTLFDRYRAMFALRDRGTEEAVLVRKRHTRPDRQQTNWTEKGVHTDTNTYNFLSFVVSGSRYRFRRFLGRLSSRGCLCHGTNPASGSSRIIEGG